MTLLVAVVVFVAWYVVDANRTEHYYLDHTGQRWEAKPVSPIREGRAVCGDTTFGGTWSPRSDGNCYAADRPK